MKLVNTAIEKLKQKSTWVGIAALSASAGWSLDPEKWSALAAVVIAAIGVWEVFRKEK
jgi:hypothetical protein